MRVRNDDTEKVVIISLQAIALRQFHARGIWRRQRHSHVEHQRFPARGQLDAIAANLFRAAVNSHTHSGLVSRNAAHGGV
jgi:hypothetical protein